MEDLEENVVIDGVEIGQGGMGGNQERGIYSHGELLNFDNIPKKTKILVPLKSLMKTLQQKSFLVSSVGPGKKVIRLGRGESVKGEFCLYCCHGDGCCCHGNHITMVTIFP